MSSILAVQRKKIIDEAKNKIEAVVQERKDALIKEYDARKSNPVFSFFRSCVKGALLWMGYDVKNIKMFKWNGLNMLNENIAIHWNGEKGRSLRVITETRQQHPAMDFSYIGWKSKSAKAIDKCQQIAQDAEKRVSALEVKPRK
jgi:hypothetical protein